MMIEVQVQPSPITVTLEVDDSFDPYGPVTQAMRAEIDSVLAEVSDTRDYDIGRMDYA